jgi:hypothetical protein
MRQKTEPAAIPRFRGSADASFNAVLLFDVIDGVADSLDLLIIFIRDLDSEFVFEFHHQLYDIQRIRFQVVDKRRFSIDIICINAQLIGDNPDYLFFSVRHEGLLQVVICIDVR